LKGSSFFFIDDKVRAIFYSLFFWDEFVATCVEVSAATDTACGGPAAVCWAAEVKSGGEVLGFCSEKKNKDWKKKKINSYELLLSVLDYSDHHIRSVSHRDKAVMTIF